MTVPKARKTQADKRGQIGGKGKRSGERRASRKGVGGKRWVRNRQGQGEARVGKKKGCGRGQAVKRMRNSPRARIRGDRGPSAKKRG